MAVNNPRDERQFWSQHRLVNRLQTALLVLTLIGIAVLAGGLLFGESGLWIALGSSLFALLVEPVAASALTLKLYGARVIRPGEAPEIWAMVSELANRASLPAVPAPYYVPSTVVNAFATGSKRHSAIALTEGLLRNLTPRELEGVIAHEMAHIANDDLRVMSLADYISRLTSVLALLGQVAIVLSLPALLVGVIDVNWIGLFLLAVSPQLALLAQLGLSRVGEFDADLLAAQLTGDPHGLVSALAKIEQVNRSWRAWIMPGWGNPEPSWLRTHPATSERIARLLKLVPQHPVTLRPDSTFSVPESVKVLRSPRWQPGGLWR